MMVLQIVVSDVGATIPGISTTEDKLQFLYEACSASVKVSLSFLFLQPDTGNLFAVAYTAGVLYINNHAKPSKNCCKHMLCAGGSQHSQGPSCHQSCWSGCRWTLDPAEPGASHMVQSAFNPPLPLHLSCCPDAPDSAARHNGSPSTSSVETSWPGFHFCHQQHPTSSHAFTYNARCSLAFRLLAQEVADQEALFTKLKDLVQDLQKAALVCLTSPCCCSHCCLLQTHGRIHRPVPIMAYPVQWSPVQFAQTCPVFGTVADADSACTCIREPACAPSCVSIACAAALHAGGYLPV